MRSSVVLLLSVALAGSTRSQSPEPLELVRTLEPPWIVSGLRVEDLTGNGRSELLVLGATGAVQTLVVEGKQGSFAGAMTGSLVLPHPSFSLVDVTRLVSGGPPVLVVASPDGIAGFPLGANGAFEEPGRALAPSRGRLRAASRLRVGAPRFVALCRDVNSDGLPDVLLPVGDHLELWVHQATAATDEKAKPTLARMARFPARVRKRLETEAGLLSDALESTFTIPDLRSLDVNGDGRQDLLVEVGRRHAFHLQRAEGTIPPEPDVELDLRIFNDTTPKGSLRPGRTLAGSDRQSLEMRDLNGDGIPDYVIAHRRKVWVFHGSREAPQFQRPSQILRSADDITTLALLDLQPDGRPDLVILKVQVPSVSGIVLGALGDLEVEVTAIGYAATEAGGFETTPRWRNDLIVKLPSVVSILRNPYALIRRFEEAGDRFQNHQEADLDGDGRQDIFVLDGERRRLKVWKGSANPPSASRDDPDALLRQVLFEDKDRSWNVDRLVELVGKVAEQDIGRRTGGRPPDIDAPLRQDADVRLIELLAGDLDGDKRAEIIALYRAFSGSPSRIDVLRVK